MVPVFAAWTLDAQSTSSWNDTLGVAIDLWALAHRGHVVVDGITVQRYADRYGNGAIGTAGKGGNAA